MNENDSRKGHIDFILKKSLETRKKFHNQMFHSLFSSEFEKVMSIKTNSKSGKNSQESPDKPTHSRNVEDVREFDQI